MNYRVDELAVPASVDATDADDFVAATTLHASNTAAAYGTDEIVESAAEALPYFHDPQSPRRLFGVREDGRIVGSATYETHAGSTTARVLVDVSPEYRRRGIGTALADHLERIAAEDGRGNRIAFVPSPLAEGARTTTDSGAGSVPSANPEVRFLVARGYRLKLVRHVSRLALPLDPAPLQARLDELTANSFTVETWIDHTPAHRLDEVARLLAQMSTDAPRGDLGMPRDDWTAHRLRELESRMAAGPTSRLYAAVADRGELVGLTLLFTSSDTARAADQNLSIVLTEHRGRRLGMVLSSPTSCTSRASAPDTRRSSPRTPRRTARCAPSTMPSASCRSERKAPGDATPRDTGRPPAVACWCRVRGGSP